MSAKPTKTKEVTPTDTACQGVLDGPVTDEEGGKSCPPSVTLAILDYELTEETIREWAEHDDQHETTGLHRALRVGKWLEDEKAKRECGEPALTLLQISKKLGGPGRGYSERNVRYYGSGYRHILGECKGVIPPQFQTRADVRKAVSAMETARAAEAAAADAKRVKDEADAKMAALAETDPAAHQAALAQAQAEADAEARAEAAVAFANVVSEALGNVIHDVDPKVDPMLPLWERFGSADEDVKASVGKRLAVAVQAYALHLKRGAARDGLVADLRNALATIAAAERDEDVRVEEAKHGLSKAKAEAEEANAVIDDLTGAKPAVAPETVATISGVTAVAKPKGKPPAAALTPEEREKRNEQNRKDGRARRERERATRDAAKASS